MELDNVPEIKNEDSFKYLKLILNKNYCQIMLYFSSLQEKFKVLLFYFIILIFIVSFNQEILSNTFLF